MHVVCEKCGLVHAPGELLAPIVDDGEFSWEDTCELEPARLAARAQPTPHSSRAYHATDSLAAVLAHGLTPARGDGPCKILDGWKDPARRRQHSDCLAEKGCPLSRRALRAAGPEAYRRFGLMHTAEQYRQVAVEPAKRQRVSSSR
jgi:hypothetical protein